MTKKILALALFIVLAMPLSAFALLKTGDMMEPFVLKTDEGQTFDAAAEWEKHGLIINFMNTVCASCNEELNAMKGIMAEYGKSAKFYPIAVDMRGADAVRPYKTASTYDYTFLIDPTFSIGRKFGITVTPATVLISKGGKIGSVIFGFDENSKGELIKALKGL